MNKIKIRLDSSATKHSKCSLDLYRMLIQGYRPKLNSQEIEFGQAFHLGVKVYEENGFNIGQAAHTAVIYYNAKTMSRDSGKKYLTSEYLMYILMEWESRIFLQDSFMTLKDRDTKSLVEMKFEFLFYETDCVEIWLCGTMDKIVEHNSSRLPAIGDYKTTSNPFPDSFLKDYAMDGQFYFYTYALKKHIEFCEESSILYKYRGKDVGVFIDGVFLRPKNEIEFQRSAVFILPQHKVDEYEAMLFGLCKRIDFIVSDADEPPKEGILNGSCKFCEFKPVCSANDKEVEKHVLGKNYIKKIYNPLRFNEPDEIITPALTELMTP